MPTLRPVACRASAFGNGAGVRGIAFEVEVGIEFGDSVFIAGVATVVEEGHVKSPDIRRG